MLTQTVGGFLESAGVSPVIRSLLVDGIISGVGGILTFLPNIFILFLALASWRTADIWRGWPMSWMIL